MPVPSMPPGQVQALALPTDGSTPRIWTSPAASMLRDGQPQPVRQPVCQQWRIPPHVRISAARSIHKSKSISKSWRQKDGHGGSNYIKYFVYFSTQRARKTLVQSSYFFFLQQICYLFLRVFVLDKIIYFYISKFPKNLRINSCIDFRCLSLYLGRYSWLKCPTT